ncbi:MAG: enoyl-CoA hydratase [Comamonadaceae bacterium]|nr:MAG: enoyl-CoA hydratase [Comamonadaceae bacterium]
MPGELRSHSEGSTLVLTLHNPEQRNALSPEMYTAGVEALNGAESSRDIRCVVLTGSDGHFCAGGSLQRLQANRSKEPQVQIESIEALHSWIEAIRTFPKPVIAAVEGAAAGAGFSLALACDLVVAARNAVFAASYSQVGLSPDGGLSWQLARALPRQLASEWLMKGERLSAERLHSAGLVNELCDGGRALGCALQLAQSLSERAPNALASIKELLAEAAQSTLDTQLGLERDHFVRNLHHPHAGAAIEAFLARSKPSQDR